MTSRGGVKAVREKKGTVRWTQYLNAMQSCAALPPPAIMSIMYYS